MRLEPPYCMVFDYPRDWSIALGTDEDESQHLFLAEGRCDGRISSAPRSVLPVMAVSPAALAREQDGGMPGGHQPARRQLTRADLPDQFTPETVRGLDVVTIRRLSHPKNGILSPDDQRSFDAALRTVMQPTTDRLEQNLRRARRGEPGGLDPRLRRSYARTEERLAAQARQARRTFPQLTEDWEAATELPESEAIESNEQRDDGISLGALESEIEQTSDTLEILEQIASIQQQQLEHQRAQVLRDVRGVFFAFLLSVAVIVAGVAPLVEADPEERRLILLWTLLVCAAAGIVYAIVRAAQSKRSSSGT